MSRALQLKPTVNFKMLLHPMQCDSRDAENDVRVDKRKLRAKGSVSVLGKILASVKSMAMLPLPSAVLDFTLCLQKTSGYAIIGISITLGFILQKHWV